MINIDNKQIEHTHVYVRTPVDHEAQSLRERVKMAAFKALYWVVWGAVATLAVATVIPAAVIITKRVRSHLKMNKTIQAMAQNRYHAVRKHIVGLFLVSLENVEPCHIKSQYGDHPGKLKGLEKKTEKENEKLKRQYVLGVIELIAMVQAKKAPNGDCHAHMQKFRGKLDELLSSPIYKQNKDRLYEEYKDQRNEDKTKNFYVKVLQDAAHAINHESPGMAPMQELGKDVVEQLGRDVVGEDVVELNYQTFANTLENAAMSHAEFKNDSKIEKVFWAFSHPQKALAACMDQTGISRPTMYNSYNHGNASIQVGEFTVGNVTYSLSQSPTLTCDRAAEAARDRGDKLIFQDIEDEHEKGPSGERGRVEAKRDARDTDLTDEGGRILHVHTPVDVHGEADADSFKLEKLNKKLVQAVKDALPDNEPARAVAFAALKGLQTMVDQAKKIGEETDKETTVYLNQSCKQNIDRGVAVNVATILLADAISGKEPQDRLHQVVGMVLTRPVMVDDRAILEKRLTPLLDVLKAMGKDDQKLVAAVKGHFSETPVSFEASTETSATGNERGELVFDQPSAEVSDPEDQPLLGGSDPEYQYPTIVL